MNREEIFKLIQSKSWIPLIDLFKENDIYKEILSDNITKNIIEQNFVNELISGNSFLTDSAYPYYLGQFFILHKAEKFTFKLNPNDYEKLIQKLVEIRYKSNNLNEAYKYALEYPENEYCQQIILEYNKEQAKFINHSQNEKITVKKNDVISDSDSTISLFKSNQEYLFYRAVREVFQTYMVFPNVALSALIDWNLIKDKLTKRENDYFFKCLIDCVVIDQENQYKPIKFIELDSIYHDTEKQIENDKTKDKIIGLSGHKLFRIRTKNEAITEKEFKTIIRETIEN